MTFDLENAWDALDEAISPSGQKKVASELNGALAEIERLRAELASANVELMAAGEIVVANEARKIAELEDALVEKQTALMPSAPRCYADARRQAAIEQLRAKGKIGPDASKSHLRPYEVVAADLAGRLAENRRKSWQITEERVGLLRYCLDTLLDAPDIEESPGPRHSIEMLRAMLTEAGV